MKRKVVGMSTESKLSKSPKLIHPINSSICAVCQDDEEPCFKEDNNTCHLPCGHIFHTTCCLKWFVQQKSCPICRSLEVQCQHKHLHDHSAMALAEVVVSQTKELETLRKEKEEMKDDMCRLVQQMNIFMEDERYDHEQGRHGRVGNPGMMFEMPIDVFGGGAGGVSTDDIVNQLFSSIIGNRLLSRHTHSSRASSSSSSSPSLSSSSSSLSSSSPSLSSSSSSSPSSSSSSSSAILSSSSRPIATTGEESDVGQSGDGSSSGSSNCDVDQSTSTGTDFDLNGVDVEEQRQMLDQVLRQTSITSLMSGFL